MRRRRPAHVMGRVRHVFRRDKDEPSLILAARLCGWTVEPVNSRGFPDLLCARAGEIRLLEVKSKGGRLEPAQKLLHARLAAAGVRVWVVYTPQDVIDALGGPDSLRARFADWKPTPPRKRKAAPSAPEEKPGGHFARLVASYRRGGAR